METRGKLFREILRGVCSPQQYPAGEQESQPLGGGLENFIPDKSSHIKGSALNKAQLLS